MKIMQNNPCFPGLVWYLYKYQDGNGSDYTRKVKAMCDVMNALVKNALENKYLGKVVYHNYGQIGYGVVTGIDDSDPQKPRLRVKFTRANTPAHIEKYNDRANRCRRLLPQSVTISDHRYADHNMSVKIILK